MRFLLPQELSRIPLFLWRVFKFFYLPQTRALREVGHPYDRAPSDGKPFLFEPSKISHDEAVAPSPMRFQTHHCAAFAPAKFNQAGRPTEKNGRLAFLFLFGDSFEG
jgi:hypothetical protein